MNDPLKTEGQMITLVVAIYSSLLLLNIWALLIRPARPWTDKFGMLLQIVGLYAFGFSVVTQTDILPSEIVTDLSSPDLFRFLSGNAAMLSVGSAAMSMALDPMKTSFTAFAFLQLFGTLVLGVFGFACIVFYALVVAPLSYVAYVLVSLPVSAITTAARDVQFVMGEQAISVQEVIAANSVLVKNLLIAFSSLALKMSLEIATAFRKARRRAGEGELPDRPGWLMRRPRIARAALLASQAMLGLLVFVLAVGALILPSMVSDDAEPPAPIGGDHRRRDRDGARHLGLHDPVPEGAAAADNDCRATARRRHRVQDLLASPLSGATAHDRGPVVPSRRAHAARPASPCFTL